MQVGPHAATLATLLPELASRVQTPSANASVAPEQQRFRLFEAVAAFLAAISAERPQLERDMLAAGALANLPIAQALRSQTQDFRDPSHG